MTGKRGPRANGISAKGPRVLIFGASGQLGSALFSSYARAGQLERVIPKTRAAVDLTNHESACATINGLKPDVVINATGMTVAATARSNGQQAWAINVAAVSNLAKACAVHGAALIHLSAADVFGADQQREPYVEPDTVHGASLLAQTRVAAEHAVMTVPLSGGGKHELLRNFRWYILRLSELFSPVDVYYPSLMRLFYDRLTKGRAPLFAPTDVVRSLSFVPVVARHIRWLADNSEQVEPGTYHLASPDSGSLYQLALELANRLPGRHAPLQETTRDDYAVAQGLAGPEIPRNTALRTVKWSASCPLPLPDWRTLVRAFAAGGAAQGTMEME